MLRLLPWIVAFVLVVGAGVVQGLHTDRWMNSPDLAVADAKLEGLPMTFGEWEGKDRVMEASQKDLAEIVGYKMRTYRHKGTGAEVQVLIMFGRPGPIAVHSPDICFRGLGYKPSGEKTTNPCKELPAMEFKTARFEIKDAAEPNPAQRVYWGWTTDGNWSAPNDTRRTFASYRALFKMYVMWNEFGNEKFKDLADKEKDQRQLLYLLLKDLHTRLASGS
jgi:hypothetical protein